MSVMFTSFGSTSYEKLDRVCHWCCKRKEETEQKTLLQCTKCRATYCSKECQKKDWKEHKTICVEAPAQFFKAIFSKSLRTITENDAIVRHLALRRYLGSQGCIQTFFGPGLVDFPSLYLLEDECPELVAYLSKRDYSLRSAVPVIDYSCSATTFFLLGQSDLAEAYNQVNKIDPYTFCTWMHSTELARLREETQTVINSCLFIKEFLAKESGEEEASPRHEGEGKGEVSD